MALVAGEGTDIFNNPALAKRAKRKVISRKMNLALIDVVKEKGEPERQQAYWNAYHCLNNVINANPATEVLPSILALGWRVYKDKDKIDSYLALMIEQKSLDAIRKL